MEAVTSILDQIDGALSDYETSGDAMRWAPPGGEAEPDQAFVPWPAANSGSDGALMRALIMDTSQFNAALAQMAETVASFMHPFGALMRAMLPVAEAVNAVRAEQVSAMHREYRRRSQARRRRH